MLPFQSPLTGRSLATLQSMIDDIEALDLRRFDASAIVPRIRALCEGYVWPTLLVEMPAAYRARRMTDRPRNVTEVWYPPAKFVTRIGRANDAGESVLYVSSSQDTALLEMRPTVGETFAVLQMVLADPTVLPHVFDIALVETSGGNDPKVGAIAPQHTAIGCQLLGPPENEAKLAMIRSFLVRQFTRPVEPGFNHNYSVSLAIAKCHRAPEIDGIWYPSIAGALRGTNAAFGATSADRLLRPYSCWMVRVEEEFPNARYLVRCIAKAEGIDDNGTICW